MGGGKQRAIASCNRCLCAIRAACLTKIPESNGIRNKFVRTDKHYARSIFFPWFREITRPSRRWCGEGAPVGRPTTSLSDYRKDAIEESRRPELSNPPIDCRLRSRKFANTTHHMAMAIYPSKFTAVESRHAYVKNEPNHPRARRVRD